MPDGGHRRTEETLRDLAELVASPAKLLPIRLSALVATFVQHDAVILLAADVSGGRRTGTGDRGFRSSLSFLDLDGIRGSLKPGTARFASVGHGDEPTETMQVLSRNGALLLLARPVLLTEHSTESVQQLWNIVALRVQALADNASPDYLRLARASSGARMEALTELADEYSTTLESALAALRSRSLDDAAARTAATAIAASGLVTLRTASDRVRTVTEEAVTTAFQRLRDDLRPLMRYREIDVQFVEPPVDGRPLPSEVAQGARAVVRGAILALLESERVRRVRVQWDCDGSNLLIALRDDGDGSLPEDSIQVHLVHQRVLALRGRIDIAQTPGWGTEMSMVLPLDPPHHATDTLTQARSLRPREREVLLLLIEGRRNREIADDLGISENTVKFHVTAIYRKLGVNSRAEATALYLSGAPAVAAR